MKKIFKSIVIIFAMLAMAVGATGAYFTDSKTISGNTFSTGKLTLNLGGSLASTINLANMEPGVWYGDATDDYLLSITNDGTTSNITAKYKIKQEKVSGSETINLFQSKIYMRAYRMESVGGVDTWVKYYDGKMNALEIDPTNAPTGNLTAGSTDNWKFAFQFDPTATSTYQNGSVSVDFIIDSTQAVNPGW